MPQESSPAFQLYVKEWRSSRAVMRMSFAERGMYLEMLLEQWENLSLPDDPAAVAELIGGKTPEWVKAWPLLRRNFAANEDDRIVNLRLEKERIKQRSRSKRQSDKGRSGADARWHKQTAEMAQASNGHDAAMPGDGFPIPISISIPVAKEVQRERGAPPRMSGTVDPAIAQRAGDFFEAWCQMYTKHRGGATYHGRPQVDYGNCCNLVRSFPNERLASLAVVFLNSNEPFIERSNRSLAVFETRISWCDEQLRKAEARHGGQG